MLNAGSIDQAEVARTDSAKSGINICVKAVCFDWILWTIGKLPNFYTTIFLLFLYAHLQKICGFYKTCVTSHSIALFTFSLYGDFIFISVRMRNRKGFDTLFVKIVKIRKETIVRGHQILLL